METVVGLAPPPSTVHSKTCAFLTALRRQDGVLPKVTGDRILCRNHRIREQAPVSGLTKLRHCRRLSLYGASSVHNGMAEACRPSASTNSGKTVCLHFVEDAPEIIDFN